MKKPNFDSYPFEVRPLSAEEGGGYLITWPDLPGCMSDGETPEEAVENGRDAFSAWMDTHAEEGYPIPKAGGSRASGRFVQRLPKSLHARLVARAKEEGVSLNTLVATIVAEGLGSKVAGRTR